MARTDSAGGGGWATTWRGTALLAVVLAAVVAALLVRAPWKNQEASALAGEDRVASELNHLAMLGHALRYHADEHDGHYPATVGDIEWRQTKPGLEANGLPAVASRFHHPETRRVMDWLYYPGRTTSDPAETVLVASPVAFGANKDRRMVTRVGNVTEVVAESDFQRQVGTSP